MRFNQLHQLLEEGNLASPASKVEWCIRMPIITLTVCFLAITGPMIEICEYRARYYGGAEIIYNHPLGYLPLLIFFAYIICFWQGLFSQLKAYNKVVPPLPREKKVIRLTWGMTITAILFSLLQLKVLSLLAIRFQPHLPK